MRDWLGIVVTVACGGIISAACASSASEKYPSPDSFCAAVAEEECQVAAACAVDPNACKATRKGLCDQHANQAVGAGRRYTAGNAQACIDKTHKLYATQHTVTPSEKADADDVCERVFAGSAQKNAPCQSNYDCAGSAICDKGLCGDKVTKNLNDGCANAGEVCGGDSYCSKTAPNVCLARKASGQPCDAANPCSASLRCDGTCSAAFTAGHVCVSDADCDTSAPFCDKYNGNKCDAGIIFAPSQTALCKEFGGS